MCKKVMCIYSCKGVCIFTTHTLLHVHMSLDLDHGYVVSVCMFIVHSPGELSFLPTTSLAFRSIPLSLFLQMTHICSYIWVV